MNTYEVLIVFKPFLDVDNADNVLKNVENTIANLKGKVVSIDKIGRKRLAYEISKFKDGYLATFMLEMPPDAMKSFTKSCQLNEDILRLTTLRLDAEQLLALTTPRPPRERTFPERGGFDRGPRPGGFDRGPRPGGFDRGPRPDGPRHFDGPRPDGPRPERAPEAPRAAEAPRAEAAVPQADAE